MVEEKVDAGDKDALEGVEKVGSEAPDRETDPGASQRIRPQVMQNVGYPQQGEQEEQRFEGFPEIRKIEWMGKRKTGKFKFICLPGGGLLKKIC